MNNKTRIIIGVVIIVLFLIGIVALQNTQTTVTNSTQITNQIQNNSTDTVKIESVKYSLMDNKSSKVNTKPKSEITDKSKINDNKSVNISQNSVNKMQKYGFLSIQVPIDQDSAILRYYCLGYETSDFSVDDLDNIT